MKCPRDPVRWWAWAVPLYFFLSLFSVSVYANSRVSVAEGKVTLQGYEVRFPNLTKINAQSPPGVPTLELHLSYGVGLEHLRIALNGIEPLSLADLHSRVAWTDRRKGIVSVLLNGLPFAGGLTFLDRWERAQQNGGELRFQINQRVRRAFLVFYRGKPFRVDHTVVLDSVEPRSTVSPSRTRLFHFHTVHPGLRTECSLDADAYVPCQGNAFYNDLSWGWHTFRVRAISADGRSGKPTQYRFLVRVGLATVRITRLIPPETVTAETSLTLHFEVKRGERGIAQCRLDGGRFRRCVSPVTFEGLSEGTHLVEIRRSNSRLEIPATYAWKVDRAKPVVEWTRTPAAITASGGAEFHFVSDKGTRFLCELDGELYSPCEPPVRLEGLSDGVHLFQVVAVDEAGNESSPIRYRWAIDTVAPTVRWTQVVPETSPTTLDTKHLSFSADEPTTFECEADGLKVNCDGSIQLGGLAEGEHEVKVVARDLAGNQSAPLVHRWGVDRTAPTALLTLAFPTHSPTQATTAELVFSSPDAEWFECALDGSEPYRCQSPERWTDLAEGNHIFSVVAMDAAGNRGPALTQRWEVDTTGPAFTSFSANPSEPVTESPESEFRFEVSEVSSVTCDLDRAGAVACNSPYWVHSLGEGKHELTVRATDRAGNVSSPVVYHWQVAFAAVATITSVAYPGETVSRSQTFMLDGSSVGYLCSLDGAAFSPCTSPQTYSDLALGDHSFSTRALNAAGVAGPAVSYAWRIVAPADTTPPVVQIVSTSPSWSPTSHSSLTIHFTASEPSRFFCALDGKAAVACVSPWTVSGLVDGSHALAISAIDSSGNASVVPAIYEWVVDRTFTAFGVSVTQITRTQALLTFQTSALGTTEARLREVGGVFQNIVASQTPSTSHSLLLTGLVGERVYQVQGRSVSATSQVAYTNLVTFLTP